MPHPLFRLCLAALLLVLASGAPAQYTATNRTLPVGPTTRSYLLATPDSGTAGKPLVLSLHGDGGTGAGMRAALPLEAAAAGAAVFVYPNASGAPGVGGTFPYFTSAGRTAEVAFVRALIDTLEAELAIDRTRVFITGFSGGATMANALGCRLEADEIRGLGIHSGSLYPIDDDFTYTGNGGVSCALPATILAWGENDATPGVTFQIGQAVRDNHRNTQGCAATNTPFAPAPCIQYDTCQRPVAWCAIPGLGHSLWNQAATAFWNFFSGQQAPPPAPTSAIYADGLQNGWENYSWGTVDFASATAQTGALGIRFDAHSFQGLSFARPGNPVLQASWPELRFFIRGTTALPASHFRVSLQTDGTLHANVPLTGYLPGGISTQWQEVRIRPASAPMGYSGSWNRLNLQDDTGTGAGQPHVVFVDTVDLLAPTTTPVFADGFE